MTRAEVTPAGQELLAGYVRDLWQVVGSAAGVEKVLVHLLLDQQGSMVEPAVEVSGQWLRLQQLDDHLIEPIGSRAASRTLVRQWGRGLLGDDFDQLTAGRPRPTRIIVTSTSPSAEPSVDSTDEEFWERDESTFELLREWWDRLVRTGDARAAW